ncbi:MAG: hypothetical protein ACAI34_16885, partial [Verrucomicrobium sp.]
CLGTGTCLSRALFLFLAPVLAPANLQQTGPVPVCLCHTLVQSCLQATSPGVFIKLAYLKSRETKDIVNI